jgi:glucosamine--fructose-6-phosphate aminotransferase (isomerizing)
METKCYKEIITQELAWQEAVDETLRQKQQIFEFFQNLKPFNVVFAGCTSPYYGGLISSSFWQSELKLQAKAAPSSELILFPDRYYDASISKPVLIALSRSGKTTETIWAMEKFEKQFPGRSVLIGCANPEGPLAKLSSLKTFLIKSDEETIPQTRSLSAMMLSSMLMGAIVAKNELAIKMLSESPSIVKGIIEKADKKTEVLFENKTYRNIFILGSGPLYGLTNEIALKCMEMSNMDTFGYQFLESRHGPRSLIDENTLVVGFYSHGGKKYEAQVMRELTEKHGATTLAVVPEEGWDTGPVSSTIAVNSSWPDTMLALPYLPVGQLVAYYCAMSKDLNPDVARNHTAYVEIERF